MAVCPDRANLESEARYAAQWGTGNQSPLVEEALTRLLYRQAMVGVLGTVMVPGLISWVVRDTVPWVYLGFLANTHVQHRFDAFGHDPPFR